MSARNRRPAIWAVVILAAAGGVLVGRATADTGPASADGVREGRDAGYSAGYYDGLQHGRAAGVQEGWTAQEGDLAAPRERPSVEQAFSDGYVAGANDAFAGYDGGWGGGDPYVVTVERATGKVVYRIDSRTPLQMGISYYLCPDGHSLCQEPRS
jgi:hypothetical protein